MKFQARPFSIEIKNRNRTTRVVSLTPEDSGTGLIATDHMVEVEDHDRPGSPDPVQSDARREAERLFAEVSAPEPLEPPREPAAPDSDAGTPRRVLPDLLTSAREEEREAVQQDTQKPTRKARVAKRRKTAKVVEAPPVVAAGPPSTTWPNVHAERVMAQARRTKRGSKLPPGQRWKERRLPRVCWDR